MQGLQHREKGREVWNSLRGLTKVGRSKDLTVEGWQWDPRKVRRLASRMDIPESTPLPEVIMVGEDADESLKKGPLLHRAPKKSPSGYLITIPESMLGEGGAPRIQNNIKHELAHYLEHSELGTHTGPEPDPYEEAAKEIRADLRGKTRNLSRSLVWYIDRLVDSYGLSEDDAIETVTRAAGNLGISSRIINRAKNMYKRGGYRNW